MCLVFLRMLLRYEIGLLGNCASCEVERGCCRKRQLTLAMTSQILDWLKQHQEDLNIINTGEEQRILVYSRDGSKFTLAMTLKVLNWLKSCQENLNIIDTGEEQRTLVYGRDRKMP